MNRFKLALLLLLTPISFIKGSDVDDYGARPITFAQVEGLTTQIKSASSDEEKILTWTLKDLMDYTNSYYNVAYLLLILNKLYGYKYSELVNLDLMSKIQLLQANLKRFSSENPDYSDDKPTTTSSYQYFTKLLNDHNDPDSSYEDFLKISNKINSIMGSDNHYNNIAYLIIIIKILGHDESWHPITYKTIVQMNFEQKQNVARKLLNRTFDPKIDLKIIPEKPYDSKDAASGAGSSYLDEPAAEVAASFRVLEKAREEYNYPTYFIQSIGLVEDCLKSENCPDEALELLTIYKDPYRTIMTEYTLDTMLEALVGDSLEKITVISRDLKRLRLTTYLKLLIKDISRSKAKSKLPPINITEYPEYEKEKEECAKKKHTEIAGRSGIGIGVFEAALFKNGKKNHYTNLINEHIARLRSDKHKRELEEHIVKERARNPGINEAILDSIRKEELEKPNIIEEEIESCTTTAIYEKIAEET